MTARADSVPVPSGRDRLSLGIDLGGTQVRAALVDGAGQVRARAAQDTDRVGGPEAVIKQIASLAEGLLAECRTDVHSLGVCAPGPLDAESGIVLEIPTLPGWVDVPLSRWLGDVLGRSVVLENDGVAAAIGEWHFGAGCGVANMVYVTVSTGIGGGVIADGHVLRGRMQMAGHVGHMTVAPYEAVCACGNTGCWEAQASGTALAAAARRGASTSPHSALARPGQPPTARHVFEAAREGDSLAVGLVEREAEWLGIGLVNLLHLYSPDLVVFGGGVSQGGFDLLEPGIRRQVLRRALPPFREVPIVRAALGPDSGLVGAAFIARADLARDLTAAAGGATSRRVA